MVPDDAFDVGALKERAQSFVIARRISNVIEAVQYQHMPIEALGISLNLRPTQLVGAIRDSPLRDAAQSRAPFVECLAVPAIVRTVAHRNPAGMMSGDRIWLLRRLKAR